MAKFNALVMGGMGDLLAAAATVSEHGFSSPNSNVGQQRLACGDEGMASQRGRADGGLDHLDFNKEGWEQNGDETQSAGFAARTENTPPASNANLSGLSP